jgi:hypothetical protein
LLLGTITMKRVDDFHSGSRKYPTQISSARHGDEPATAYSFTAERSRVRLWRKLRKGIHVSFVSRHCQAPHRTSNLEGTYVLWF